MGFKSPVKKVLEGVFAKANISLVPTPYFEKLKQETELHDKVRLLPLFTGESLQRAVALLERSPSQINQDLFVLSELDWKRDGFFVDFGATDGKTLSNSWLLEKEFGWRGILAEPGRVWRDALSRSGRTAAIDFDCVWSESGQTLNFTEAEWSELSTISTYKESDHHKRKATQSYQVRTVSLNDLLARHNAPSVMDYLSIDTEGSEYEILQRLDFDRYRFRCITCEHNHGPTRDAIHQLLTSHGYERRHENRTLYDDWYVHRELV